LNKKGAYIFFLFPRTSIKLKIEVEEEANVINLAEFKASFKN